eukprot:5006731-Heterocapsa_arctica.AAC.1
MSMWMPMSFWLIEFPWVWGADAPELPSGASRAPVCDERAAAETKGRLNGSSVLRQCLRRFKI